MANKLYPKGREAFLAGDLDWDANNIKVVLVDATYTYSDSHQYLSSIDAGDRVATSGNLASKTVTDGVADAADVTFSAVSGNQVTQFVIYQDTGNAATSRLIAHIDTASGLPLTPNGGDITITWDNGASKIFKL
ncbi:MAG: hypothetical protein FJ013_00350 [Chloroflexi bacterium]|nr:hypothetical protein [Chloroflexota bacterium]